MSGFKDIIRKNYWGSLAVSYFHCAESAILPKLISDEEVVKRYYKHHTGRNLNLINPQTFSEKLNWYKLNDRKPLMQQCADKVSVRDYVKACGYGDTLNEVYNVYDSVDQINIDELPDQFVLKAAHGSHMQYIVKSKASLNWKRVMRMMRSWLRQNIYWSGREWPYKDMPRRIIAEKYIEDDYGGLRDYKIYCFNGKPQYIDVDVDRFSNHFRNFYDLEWNLIPMSSVVPNNIEAEVVAPQNLKKMIEMARILSKPFQFVRVDLYEVQGKIMFGEMTFFQDGGYAGYSEEYEKIIGDFWTLRK